MGTSAQRFLRRLERVERGLKRLSTTPQLAYSSIEDGALRANNGGSLTMIIGQQFDGTNAAAVVNGPTPPTPSQPVVERVPGGVRVRWDGQFVDNAFTPMDFQRVEVHVADLPESLADTPETLRSTFETPRGAETFVALPAAGVLHYVLLVTRSQSGARSLPSLEVEVIPEAAVTEEDWETIQTTARDASNTAYAADGRVSISDYEPSPADVLGKNDGSLWITRTRDRTNFCTNPSFEASLADWGVVGATHDRIQSTPAADGLYVQRVTNDSSAGDHLAHWGSESLSPVLPGQEVTISGYARLFSGLGIDCDARIDWVGGDGLSIGDPTAGALTEIFEDDPENEDSDFARLWVTGVAPEGAVWFRAAFNNPNPDAVWDLDAVLIEYAARLGRYFDGDSEGGSWADTPLLSPSELDGGAIIRLFNLEDGSWSEKFWTADTISSLNASVIDRGEMDGFFIADGSIPPEKLQAPPILCSEAVTAGDLVNVWNDGGRAAVRRAGAGLATSEVLATNHVHNSSGEVDATGWIASGGSDAPVSSTEQAWVGSASIKAMRGAGTNSAFGLYLLHTDLPAAGDYPLRLRLWVPSIIPTGGLVGIRLGGSGVTAYNVSTDARDQWVEMSLPFTWDGVGTVLVQAYDGHLTSGGYMYVDAMTTSDAPYFDGDTPDQPGIVYAWDGTPHASKSTKSTVAMPTREAHGFVLASSAAGEMVKVYTDGYDTLAVGLVPGPQFLSVTPGRASSSPPTDAGAAIQRVGFATNATNLNFTAGSVMKLI